MKRSRLLVALTFAFFISTGSSLTSASGLQEDHGNKHGFGVRQYENFHEALHPLQHEALPNKNYKELRAKSALLSSRGRAIVRLGIPRGTSKENRAEFSRELARFTKTLTKYRADARRGSDAQLEASYSAVHDSFEMLAAMLPRS